MDLSLDCSEANLARRSWLLLASSWPFREAICCETWRMLKLRGRSCSWINFGDRVLRSPGVRDNIAEEMLSCWERLSSIPSDGGPRERQLLEEIEESLSQQESISSAMLSLTPGDRKTRSPKFIQEQLLPRSLSILQVSQQIASLNGQELAKSNQDLLARFASLQSKLKSMLLAALTAGLVLSLLGTFYVLHLERQERERYLALADNRL